MIRYAVEFQKHPKERFKRHLDIYANRKEAERLANSTPAHQTRLVPIFTQEPLEWKKNGYGKNLVCGPFTVFQRRVGRKTFWIARVEMETKKGANIREYKTLVYGSDLRTAKAECQQLACAELFEGVRINWENP